MASPPINLGHTLPTIRDPLNILTDFDKQTANTGGIRRISASRSPRGRFEVTVEGFLLPPLWRNSGQPPPGRVRAPNFNSAFLTKQNAKDLRARWPAIDQYQMAHLWGPGFGDETPAGMMWAPAQMNLDIQNSRIEEFVRQYYQKSIQIGAPVQLRASAVAWDWQDNAADFLRYAEYELGRGADGGYEACVVCLEAPIPGRSRLGQILCRTQRIGAASCFNRADGGRDYRIGAGHRASR